MKFTPAHSTIRWMVMVVPALLISAFVAGLAGGLAPVSAQACSWTGQWDTMGSDGIVTLMQAANQVAGKGTGEYYKGTVSGNTFTGGWSEYSDGTGDHGALQLTMDASCNSFTGLIGLNLSTSIDPSRSEPFKGTRVGGTPYNDTAADNRRRPATATGWHQLDCLLRVAGLYRRQPGWSDH